MPSLLTPNSRSPKSQPPHPNDNSKRSTSPSYFGLVVDSQSTTIGSSGSTQVQKDKWTPPSSSIRSAAASSPQAVPLDQSKEFEVFKRQVEERPFKFQVTSDEYTSPTSTSKTLSEEVRPSGSESFNSSKKTSRRTQSLSKSINIESIGSETYKSGSPKRLLSYIDSSAHQEKSRRGSPPWLQRPDTQESADTKPLFHEPESRQAVPSVQDSKPADNLHSQVDSLTSNMAADSFEMASAKHVVDILDSQEEETLILDLRVSTHYVRSRIRGALNLCIPTTLLKRPSYNVHRLADTFKNESQKFKFENWRGCARIIVYDHCSALLQEAQGCVNILKKFESEGWMGNSCIIRGGFVEFAQRFPAFIESGPDLQHSGYDFPRPNMDETLQQPATPSVAPVIGGCPMPADKSAANPFFGNIRQNMDLIGGVGQIAVNLPASTVPSFRDTIPRWLQIATDQSDQGKYVSERFLQIEKREQKRMQDALSGNVTYDHNDVISEKRLQIAGLEKGSKNRYNNIWPFEHTRMKLKGVANDGCDYINASLVQTSVSKRRYVATQAPIPATFSDFWSMIWQNDIRVVIMLTAEMEGAQVKAHNYWRSKHYGSLKLTPLTERRATLEPARIHRHRDRQSLDRRHSSQSSSKGIAGSREKSTPGADQPYVLVRKFTLAHENEPFSRVREITQLQYSHWPDFGAPANPSHLLGLIEQCDSVVRSIPHNSDPRKENIAARPVLVHCSAGCGRTGTFCAVDSVIDALRSQQQRVSGVGSARSLMELDRTQRDLDSRSVQSSGEFWSKTHELGGGEPTQLLRDDVDLVEKVVEELRLQRLSMVQSLRQFVLVYETVAEWLAGQR